MAAGGSCFSSTPAGPESSVAVSQSEETGCVNWIEDRDTADFCICFGLGFCVMNGFWVSSERWREFSIVILLRQASPVIIVGAIYEDLTGA